MIYYDFHARTGWLVPGLSFVLHLAFKGLRRHSLNVHSLDQIQYAAALADGGQAALAAFHRNQAVVVTKERGPRDSG
jgi:hypothetical protein